MVLLVMPPMEPELQAMGPGPMAPPYGMHPGMNPNMRDLPMQAPQV